MHKGAIGMLDYYGLRESLVSLATKGYAITVVGHSLGAGNVLFAITAIYYPLLR